MASQFPAAVALVAVMLEDAYTNPETPPPLKAIHGATLAIGVACLSQAVLLTGNPDWAVPRWTLLAGCVMGLLLISCVRMLFPPVVDRPQSANGFVFWRERESLKISAQAIWLIFQAATLVLVTAFGVRPGLLPLSLC